MTEHPGGWGSPAAGQWGPSPPASPAPGQSTWSLAPSGTWGAPYEPPPVPPPTPYAPAERRLPTWVVVLALVLLPPLGLVLMWVAGRWRTRVRVAVTAAVVLLMAAALVGAGGDSGPQPRSAAPVASPSPSPSATAVPQVLAALAALAVSPDHPTGDYDRAAFGAPWTDTDRNGCDTRNDILGRDLTDVVFKPGTRDCAVLSGVLVDPYSGATLAFERGKPSGIEVDHVVALADAWRSGGSSWPYAKLLAFANDPLGLLAVAGEQNQAKSDSDAAQWLPPQGRCAYAARQVAVKAKYELSVTPAERAALAGVLAQCPQEPLPRGGTPTLAPNRQPAPPPTPSPTPPQVNGLLAPAPQGPQPADEGADPDYGTCAEARRAGAGPYYRGPDPEYEWYRDTDDDGVVCER